MNNNIHRDGNKDSNDQKTTIRITRALSITNRMISNNINNSNQGSDCNNIKAITIIWAITVTVKVREQ